MLLLNNTHIHNAGYLCGILSFTAFHDRLQQCYDATPELQTIKPLTLRKSLGSLRLNLYNKQQGRLVSFRSLKNTPLK